MSDLCEECTYLSSARLLGGRRLGMETDPIFEYAVHDQRTPSSPDSSSPSHFFRSWSAEEFKRQASFLCEDTRARIFVHKNLDEIRESSRTCRLCGLIHFYILTPREADFAQVDRGSVYLIPLFSWKEGREGIGKEPKHMCFKMITEIGQHPPQNPLCSLQMRAPVSELDVHHNIQFGVQTDSPFSEATTDRIKKWHQECRDEHKSCKAWTLSEVKAPVRLLRIDSDAATDKVSVKLVEAENEALRPGEALQWAALSHCWGDRVPMVLTHDVYADWLHDIPLQSLPRTFREAVIATKALKLDYLWIDALCIFQDIEEDFQKQAPTMRSIYGSSALTLAATASLDGNGGLFLQNRLGLPHVIDFSCTGGKTLIGPRVVSPPFKDCYKHDITEAKLNNRGWVFQERALSPRTVHFARGEIWWSCLERIDKETHDGSNSIADESLAQEIFDDKELRAGDFSRHSWETLVEWYSMLKLSKMHKDRLVALSGIAESFGMHRGLSPADYKAGLWLSDFKSHLLWGTYCRERIPGHMLLDDGDDGDSADAVAPTWSWASYDGPVTFWHATPETNWHPSLRVLNVDVRTFDDNPFGSFAGCGGGVGGLHLRSVVLAVESVSKFDVIVRDATGTAHHLYLYDTHDVANIHWFEGWNCDAQNRAWSSRKVGHEAATHLMPMCDDRNAYMLQVKSWFRPVADGDRCLGVLLLRAVSEEEERKQHHHRRRGMYVRVGARAYIHPYVPAWWSAGSQLAEHLHLGSHGGGVYDIRIV